MVISCKNCNGYFTQDELLHRRPPAHPWQLTPVGQRVLLENQHNGGDPRQCPTCGQKTLRA